MTSESDRLVEAALFISGKPISVKEIQTVQALDPRTIRSSLRRLQERYDSDDQAIEIVKIGAKYSMQIKDEYRPKVAPLASPKLSKDVLKIASLIGYYQPILRSKLSDIAGSKTYECVRQLVEKGLIRAHPKNRSFELTTTKKFIEYFSIDARSRAEVKAWFKDRLKS